MKQSDNLTGKNNAKQTITSDKQYLGNLIVDEV